MIPTKEYITQLIKERERWTKIFDIDSARIVFNPLIRYHINGYKKKLHTLRPDTILNPTNTKTQ